MTGNNGTVFWYGIGLRPGQIERLARHPGWEPAGLARAADTVAAPREPVDVWLLQAPDLAEALRCGRLVRSRHREGSLWLLPPPEAPADVWQAAAAALLGSEPSVRVVTSLDQALAEPSLLAAMAPGITGRGAVHHPQAAGRDGHPSGPAPCGPEANYRVPAETSRPEIGTTRLDGLPEGRTGEAATPGNRRWVAGPASGQRLPVPDSGLAERPARPPEPSASPRNLPPAEGPGQADHAARGAAGSESPAARRPPAAPASPDPGAVPPAAGLSGTASGVLVAVAGAKGGAGRTWLACELAVAAAARGLRAALIDAHWAAADAAVVLDLPAGPTVLDLQPLLDGPEEAWLDQWLVHPRSGLRVLAGPPRPDLAGLVEPQTLGRVIRRALGCFDLVVVDTPAAPAWLEDAGLHGCPASGILVTTPEAAALRRTRLWLEEAALAGKADWSWCVVVNRWSGSHGSRQATEGYLGVPVTAWIPDDPGGVQQAAAAGLPLVLAEPGHPAARAVGTLLAQLLGQPLPGPRPGRLARLWRRWRAGGRQAGAVTGEGVTAHVG
ncbi:AAA family ATPase [Thermaerobacter subterraneus]|uniref:ATPase involved in chromosome partitioning n=1 Tax=Thermaerobacter subterraneus DSM 13965 TaxID=867903 RepID=K6PZ07_9FIRM|nr:ATPase involved in chromosome partitioning [Thermaerobacter subterraneus]EKP93799.1 ATPase involved in chromosome partitioning [Thermaerobacter subterraneus DSM 13965]